MDLSGKLWPAHPKPLSDELLSSWIVRLAHANGLKLQTFCDRVFGKEHQLWNRDIDRLAPRWLLTALAAHTGTPMTRVRETTLDIYRGRLFRRRQTAGQLRWILPAGVYHRKRRRFGMQFCPQCLAEDQEPYFRTRWRVAALTFCPQHNLELHDRCPQCAEPVAFHRSELGHPEITAAGPLCLCHACGFNLRGAKREPFDPYTVEIGLMSHQLSELVAGQRSGLDIGFMDVLHQLCKSMVSRRRSARLAEYVSLTARAPTVTVPRGGYAFELRPINERRHVLQLVLWLLMYPATRIHAAWEAKAIRYNELLREFPIVPSWYLSLTERLKLRSKGTAVSPPQCVSERNSA